MYQYDKNKFREHTFRAIVCDSKSNPNLYKPYDKYIPFAYDKADKADTDLLIQLISDETDIKKKNEFIIQLEKVHILRRTERFKPTKINYDKITDFIQKQKKIMIMNSMNDLIYSMSLLKLDDDIVINVILPLHIPDELKKYLSENGGKNLKILHDKIRKTRLSIRCTTYNNKTECENMKCQWSDNKCREEIILDIKNIPPKIGIE